MKTLTTLKNSLVLLCVMAVTLYSCKKGNGDTPTPTAPVPTLTTTAFSGLTPTSAVSGGTITSDGGSNITARGVCWSTTANPTIANSKTIDGSGTGTFTSSLTGLTLSAGAIYYIRAYATNSAGTGYGNQIMLLAADLDPTLTVTISYADVSVANEIVVEGVVRAFGSQYYLFPFPITAMGTCWSTTPNPTIANNKTVDSDLGQASFVSGITGLTGNTTYYIRAYATNNSGTAYSTQMSLTTH